MIGIIGGTGLDELKDLEINEQLTLSTEYGEPSNDLIKARQGNTEFVFLPRHGADHSIAPHLINYRANIQALSQVGVDRIVAINAVGGISERCGPADIIFPDQIIDYTYGRQHTFYDTPGGELDHIDFTYPYDPALRESLIAAANSIGVPYRETGTYGATQGPRLETPAEVRRLRQDGCDIVGMTGMPEAALAREAGVPYASIALSVNWAAGITDEVITMQEINAAISQGMGKVLAILTQLLAES